MVKDTGALHGPGCSKRQETWKCGTGFALGGFAVTVVAYRTTSRRVSHLRLRLLQIEPHIHLAVHRRRGGEVFARLFALARARAQLPEAEVAVGDERTHAARLGEGQGLAVVG